MGAGLNPAPDSVRRLLAVHDNDYWRLGAGFRAAFAAKLNLHAVADMLPRLSALDSGEVALVTDQGKLVIRPRVSSAELMRTRLPETTTSVPHDLLPPERLRFYQEMLKGFRYCRLAGGLYWRGLDPEGDEPCTALGKPATLILLGDDYDVAALQ